MSSRGLWDTGLLPQQGIPRTLWDWAPAYDSSTNFSSSPFNRALCLPIPRCKSNELLVVPGEGLAALTSMPLFTLLPGQSFLSFVYLMNTNLTLLTNPLLTPAHIHLCTHILLCQSSTIAPLTLDWIYLIPSFLNRLQAL